MTTTLHILDEGQFLGPIAKGIRDGRELGRPVIVVIGWAKNLPPEAEARISLLFERAIAPIANEFEAVLVDGGTDAGVMATAGKAISELSPEAITVGVVPRSRVVLDDEPDAPDTARLEPNHHHAVLVPGEAWSDGMPYFINLVERLAVDSPIAVILIGGGSVTQEEYQACRAHGWPVLVIAGASGCGDEVARAEFATVRPRRGGRKVGRLRLRLGRVKAALLRIWPRRRKAAVGGPQDLVGVPAFCGRNQAVAVVGVDRHAEVRRQLRWKLSNQEGMKLAWGRILDLDAIANVSQPRLIRMRLTGLFLLGFAAAFGALSPLVGDTWGRWLKAAVVALTAFSSAIFMWIQRRSSDRRWLAPRAGAELLKSATFRVRTQVRDGQRTPDEALADTMANVESNLASTVHVAVDHGARRIWPGNIGYVVHQFDEMLDPLTPAQYLEYRLENQLKYYGGAIKKHDRRIARATLLSAAIGVVIGVMGVVVNAKEMVYAGLLATVSSLIATWQGFDQSETQIKHKALAAARLSSLQGFFYSQDMDGRATSFDSLVAETERVLVTETNDWMRDLIQVQNLFGDPAKGHMR